MFAFETFKPYLPVSDALKRLFAAEDSVLIPLGLVYREARAQTSMLVILDVNPNWARVCCVTVEKSLDLSVS